MKNIAEIIVTGKASVIDVMKLIEETSSQIAIVADEKNKLIGTITDGDIRRAILKGISLTVSAVEVMNPHPTFVSEEVAKTEVLDLMRRTGLGKIPIVSEKGVVVGLHILEDLLPGSNKILSPVVLMAGGLGARLGSLTENCPKPLLKVGKKPILEIIMDSFIEQGFSDFYMSVNYKSEMIEDYFGDGKKWGVSIRYIKEPQKMGTAGALGLAEFNLDEPILVMNGDLLTKVNFRSLVEHHKNSKAMGTMCVRQYDFQVPYGVVQLNKDSIEKLEEKPVHSFFVNGGIYLLDTSTLKYIPKGKSFDMPSLFQSLISAGEKTSVFPIHEYWLDIGRLDDFERANSDYSGEFE